MLKSLSLFFRLLCLSLVVLSWMVQNHGAEGRVTSTPSSTHPHKSSLHLSVLASIPKKALWSSPVYHSPLLRNSLLEGFSVASMYFFYILYNQLLAIGLQTWSKLLMWLNRQLLPVPTIPSPCQQKMVSAFITSDHFSFRSSPLLALSLFLLLHSN